MQMGLISLSMGFTLQRPAFGAALNMRETKHEASALVWRRPDKIIVNSLSTTQIDSNVGPMEDVEFKSSFDEYLKAMESIRADREKKKDEKGSHIQKKKLKDVTSSKGVREDRDRGERNKFRRFGASGSKEEDERNKVSHGMADKGRRSGSVQGRKLIKIGKDANFVKVKDGSTKKLSKDSTSLAISERVRSKDFREDRVRGERNKFRRFEASGSKEEDEPNKVSHGMADKGRRSGSVQERKFTKMEKDANFIKVKDGSIKKLSTGSTFVAINERVRSKHMPMSEMNIKNELEMRDFLLEPSESLDDFQDGRRVTRMEMEERIQNLADRLNEADMNMPEWVFSKTMRSAKIKFSDYSIIRVIQILGKHENWRRVLQVVEWLQMQERFKSHKIRYVYTAALDVLCKARRPVEALNLFCSMQRHKASYPDIVSYHSVAVTLGQAGHMKELFDVIDSMRSMPKNFKIDVREDRDPRLEPDLVVYNAVLNACVKRKEWEGALWVLQKLAEVDQQPSSTTYGLVMEVMLACGKYDLVHELFKKLQEFSVPNALTYRVLVNTFWREGKPDEGIEAVQNMERRGLVGPASLYYDLARCLCSVGRCEEALMQVDKICKVASKPLVVTYTGLIQACLDQGNIHNGEFIFNHMQKYCSPNTVTCNIMLKAYLGHGMFDDAKELFQKMAQSAQMGDETKSRIRADLHTFNIMLKACSKAERWGDFEYAYEQMLDHKHPFNTKRHLWMVLQASNAGKVQVVETTWRHLLRTDRIPPPALIKERFRLKMENDDVVEAVSSVACHPSSPQKSFSKEAWSKLFEDNAHRFKKEALEQLIDEVDSSISKSELPNFIYQNLLQSCLEFIRLGETVVADRTDVFDSSIVLSTNV